jgi:hypothetical protein
MSDDFSELPRRARYAIDALQVRTWNELASKSSQELLCVRHFGPLSLTHVSNALALRGLALADALETNDEEVAQVASEYKRLSAVVVADNRAPWRGCPKVYSGTDRRFWIYFMRFSFGDRVLVKVGRTGYPPSRFVECAKLAAWKLGVPRVRGSLHCLRGSSTTERRALERVAKIMDPIGREWFSPRAGSLIVVPRKKRPA